MAERVKATTYIKNVAKSFGYAMSDTLTSFNPVLTEMGKQAKETVSDAYQTIKSFKADASLSMDEKNFKGGFKSTIDDALKGLREDITTGQWYNKSRQSAMESELAKAMGFDMSEFEFDFNFDEEDWGDGETSSAQNVVASNEMNTRQIIGAVDMVGAQVAGAVSSATVESAAYIAGSARESARALYGLNQRGFSSITQALLGVNNSIISFAKIGEPLSAHMQNSSVFYTRTSEQLNNIQQSLQQIVKNTTPAPLSTDTKYKRASGTLDSIISSEGVSIDAWKSMIKENFGDSKEFLSMFTGGLKGFKGGNIPIANMATSFLTNVMLPKVFKDSMTMFNESLKTALTGGIVKARNHNSGNLVVSILQDLFLPKDAYKNTINPASYEKGRVAWDGISRKALTYVIPKLLSQIYSAISGAPAQVFDYNSGKFVTDKDIRNVRAEREKTYVKRAGGNFREDALAKVKNGKRSKADQERLEKEIESYFTTAFRKGRDYEVFQKGFKTEDFGLGDESLAIIKELINEYRTTKDPSKRNRHTKFITENALTRDDYGNEHRRLEATGDDLGIHLVDGFKGVGKGGIGTDEYNHSSIFYLQGIYQYTGYLADNIDYIAGNRKRARKRGKLKKGGEVDEIKTASSGIDNSAPISAAEVVQDSYIDEDEKAAKEREDMYKDASKQVKEKAKTTKEKVRAFFHKISPKNLKKMYDRPFEAMSGLLNSLTYSLDKFLWGQDPDNPQEGLLGYITEHTKNAFGKLNDWIKDITGVDIGEKIKELFGKAKDTETWKGFANDTKENLRQAGKWTKNQFASFFGAGKAKAVGETVDLHNNGQAYNGRQVTKTGIIAVSEGELVVPPHLNPFYHGSTSRRARISGERKAMNTFFGGSFDNGGTVKDSSSGGEPKGGSSNENEGFGHMFFREGFATIGKGLSRLYTELIGDGKKETAEQEKSIIGNIAKTALKEAGDNKGAMAAGGIIGAGVSIATGALVGPLAGAAIGAGVGLAVKSQTVQKLLFGDVDEEGNKKGGLLNKEVSNFITKNLPNIAKGGVLGAAGGLFLGSPVLGAVLGSTVSYVSGSEKAQEALFGKVVGEDEEGNKIRKGGIIPQEMQKNIKAKFGNVAAGTILGALAGPFGMAGNLVLGAGLGYLTTTTKFHDWMFGKDKDDKNGMVNIVREKILGNLDTLFHNMFNQLKGWGKNLISKTGERIKDFLSPKAKALKDSKLGKVLGAPISAAGGLIKGATKGVGGVLQFAANRSQSHNLRKGYGVYDRKKKRNMFASERMDARGGSTFTNMGRFDNILAQAGSAEELDQLQQQLEDAKDPSRYYKRRSNEALRGVYDALGELDSKTADQVAKRVRKGDHKSVIEIAQLLDGKVDPAKREEIMSKINSSLDMMQGAKNSKARSKELIANFKAQGIDIKDTSDINNMLDQIKYERGNEKFSPEEQAKKKEADWRERVTKVFESMDISLAKMAGRKTVDGEEPDKVDGTTSEKKEEEKTSIVDFLKSTNVGDADEKTEFTDHGVITYTRDSKGNWSPKNGDTATAEAEKRRNRFHDAISHIPVIGTAMGGLATGFGWIKDKLFGSDEKTPGLFDKLFDFLSGDAESPLANLLNFFTGNPMGTKTKNIGKSTLLSGVLRNVVGPAFLLMGLDGTFDPLMEKFTGGAYGKGSKADIVTDSVTGETLTKDTNGNYVNANGEVSSNVSVRKGSVSSFSDKLKYNTARGVMTNTKSVASTVLKKTTLGQSLAKNAASMGTKNALSGTIMDACAKFTSMLKKVPALSGLAENLDNMGAEIAGKISEKMASEGAEKIAKFASNAVVWAKVAFIVIDFTTGYEDARTTLGIIDEPTVPQKILSGLLRAIKNFIPIIGSLIPDSLVIDIFCKYIAPVFGIKATELMKQREEAQNTVNAYNQEHGTNYSVGEYNKSVLKDYTWTERIGNAAKSTWESTKQKGKNLVSGIKEKGFGGYMKDTFTQMGADFMNSYKSEGGGLAGVFKGMGDMFGNMLPGVLGEIKRAKGDIRAKASKGDLKGLWSVALSDFSGGQVNADGITTAAPSIFSKVIGQIPLLMTKLGSTPMALFSSIFQKGKEFIFGDDGLVEKAGRSIEAMKQGSEDLKEIAKSGDVGAIWKYQLSGNDPDNPIGGFTKFLFNISKLANTFVAAFHWISNKISGLIEGAKETLSKIPIIGDLITGESTIGDIASNAVDAVKNSKVGQFVGDTIDAVKNSKVGQAVSGAIDTVKNSAVGKAVSGAIDTVKNSSVGKAVSSAGNWVKDKAGKAAKWVKGLFGGSSGLMDSFVSQVDPRYKNMKMGGSTVGQKGCAPAVATMISNIFGKKLNMDQAVNAAGAYQSSQGTRADYFSKILGAQGIGTDVISGKKKEEQILSSLGSGQPVVLLGKDKANKSKKNSPFGPNGHYVLAVGVDKKGNILVSDPESQSPKVYNKSILSHTNLGIATVPGGSGTGLSDILSGITNAFGNITSSLGLDKLFDGFTTAFGNMLGLGGEATAASTEPKPTVLGNVPEGKGNSLQKKIVQYAESRLGKNTYSQNANLRTKVDSGYSDCSSFAQWCYKQALGIDPGGYTGAQIESPLLTPVDTNNVPDQANLEAGDLLFFRSKSNNGRKYNVGHVEVYDGNGNLIGHGGGVGPKKRSMSGYVDDANKNNRNYIMAMRYKDIANMAGGSSGLLLSNRPGSYVYGGSSNISLPKHSGNYARKMYGGASNITNTTVEMLNTARSTAIAGRNSGTISADLVETLIKSIIAILEKIANNTVPIAQIYQALLASQSTNTAQAKAAQELAEATQSANAEIDDGLKGLVGALAAIAKG